MERNGEDLLTLFASDDGGSVNHGLGRNDKQRSCLLLKDVRTAGGRTTAVGGLCVENDLQRADKSGSGILKDPGRERGFAPPAVGLARVDREALDGAEDDGLLGLVADDGSADGARASLKLVGSST